MRRFVLRFSAVLILFFPNPVQDRPPVPSTHFYIEWTTLIDTEQTIPVRKNDWVEIRVICRNTYVHGLDHCAEPVYWKGMTEVKFKEIDRTVAEDDTTEQIFGTRSPITGLGTVLMPVVYGGIPYNWALEITAGPGH